MKKFSLIPLITLLGFLISCSTTSNKYPASPPNIIIIVADGLGFSDLGHFGSEINTPNLDLLAEQGLVLSEFYNAGGFCQTSASLFTGLYPGQAGITYPIENTIEGCTGPLNDQCTNLAWVLKTAGYRTLLTGNWLFKYDSVDTPSAFGFDDYFIHNELANHFYENDTFTDTAVQYIKSNSPGEIPYLLWLSYTSPQGPGQDSGLDLEKYKGIYERGWEAVRDQRFLKLINNGLFSMDESMSPQDIDAPHWDSIGKEEQEAWVAAMEVYAAIIDHMDQGIGKILSAIEESGERDNTLIIFISGNSGSDESLQNIINSYQDPEVSSEGPDSLSVVFRPWARVLHTPFNKGYTREGGISSPFIACWPDGIDELAYSNYASHVIDLMPTVVEVSGASYPELLNNKPVPPMEGISLVPLFSGEEPENHDFIYWDFMGSRAIRMGDYKIVADRNDEDWVLYDIAADRCEQEDLSEDAPQEIKGMQKIFKQESKRIGLEE